MEAGTLENWWIEFLTQIQVLRDPLLDFERVKSRVRQRLRKMLLIHYFFEDPFLCLLIAVKLKKQREEAQSLVEAYGPYKFKDVLRYTEGIVEKAVPFMNPPVRLEEHASLVLKNYLAMLIDAVLKNTILLEKPVPVPMFPIKELYLDHYHEDFRQKDPLECALSEYANFNRWGFFIGQQDDVIRLKPWGYGVYLFPPRFIGTCPKYSLSDLLRVRSTVIDASIARYQYQLFQKPVIGFANGFLMIKDPDAENATKTLNRIFACLLSANFEVSFVGPGDLWRVYEDFQEQRYVLRAIEDENLGSRMMKGLTESNQIELPRERLFETHSLLKTSLYISSTLEQTIRLPLPKSVLELAIAGAEENSRSPWVLRAMELYGDSVTHKIRGNYETAFLLAWNIVERDIVHHWERYIGQHFEAEQKSRHEYSSVGQILRFLSKDNGFDRNYLKTARELNNLRNKVVHENILVSMTQLDALYKFTNKIIDNHETRR